MVVPARFLSVTVRLAIPLKIIRVKGLKTGEVG